MSTEAKLSNLHMLPNTANVLTSNKPEGEEQYAFFKVCLSSGLTSSKILPQTSCSVLLLDTRISARLADQSTAITISLFSGTLFYTSITSYLFICLNCRLCRTDIPELHSSVHGSLKLRLLSAFIMQNSF